MRPPFPCFQQADEGKELHDGVLIKVPRYYQKNFKNSKYKRFYSTIKDQPGFHTSPSGFSCFVDDKGRVFVGLRVAEHYDRALNKFKLESDEFNPVLNESQFLEILSSFDHQNDLLNITQQKLLSLKNLHEEDQEFNNQTIHEIRKLNATIKGNTESLIKILDASETLNAKEVEMRIKPIFAASSLTTARLNIFDLSQNPGRLGEREPVSIHNKFYKAAKCLEDEGRRINVELTGECYKTILAYECFEFLPVLLIDNAVKYSPPGQTVTVDFLESEGSLTVTVESLGPMLEDCEYEKIMTKGYRGKNAIGSRITGSGFGLYLADGICDLHSSKLSVESDKREVLRFNEVPYSAFRAILHF